MPICPNCRTGYDDEAECPECGTKAPEPTTPSSSPTSGGYRCSDLGIFCIFCAWLGSIVVLPLSIITAIRNHSEMTEWALTLLNIPLHLGVCYALWIALKVATDKKS